jgi:hypothetical protein
MWDIFLKISSVLLTAAADITAMVSVTFVFNVRARVQLATVKNVLHVY